MRSAGADKPWGADSALIPAPSNQLGPMGSPRQHIIEPDFTDRTAGERDVFLVRWRAAFDPLPVANVRFGMGWIYPRMTAKYWL